MLVESMLAKYMRNVTGGLLAFREGEPPSFPCPPESNPRLLYLHIPFCEHLCPYCSFNRVQYREALARRYFVALKREIEIYRELGFSFETVYVGGGTPTVMPEELSGILDFIRSFWPVKRISVETNPNHLTADVIGVLRDAGVERLSVGVETFDDSLLKSLGRLEAYGSGREIEERLSAVQGKFETLNIDLMFNLFGQTRESLLADIDVVKRLGVDQATFYPLMCSDSARGLMESDVGEIIDYRKEASLYSDIIDNMTAPYRQASAWCFSSKSGMIDEYIVDHEEYAGLGSGAFGYVNGTIYSNTFSVERYMKLLEAGSLPLAASRKFPRSQRVAYDLLMSLFGGSLKLREITQKYGGFVWLNLWAVTALLVLTGGGRLRDGCLMLRPRGLYFLVILMREFFTGVNNLRHTCADLSRLQEDRTEGLFGGLNLYSPGRAEVSAGTASDTRLSDLA